MDLVRVADLDAEDPCKAIGASASSSAWSIRAILSGEARAQAATSLAPLLDVSVSVTWARAV
jgi:hypothetical protein